MTQKHLNALAAEVANIADPTDRQRIADLLGGICAGANPRFDWSRWLKACGVSGGSLRTG